MNLCKWAVVYYIDGSNYDDGKQRRSIVAIFRDPFQAEDFILKCLPAENRERFSVINVKEDCDAELNKK